MREDGFLASLSDEDADALRAAGVRRRYGAQVTLVHQDDEAGPVVVLLGGRAKIAVTEAGREAIVGVVGPGELIGELAAIEGSPRSTTVTTLEPVEALVIRRSDFLGVLDRRPRIGSRSCGWSRAGCAPRTPSVPSSRRSTWPGVSRSACSS